jgi:hypothetical protein
MMIPRSVDDLTAAWCSDALGRKITNVSSEPLGVGVGLVAQLARLTLESPDGTSTLIAKVAAPDEEGRFVPTVLNMYGREVGFYRELALRADVASPDCFYAEHDPVTQDTVLLLEDVSARGRQLDQLRGCTLDEARPAISALARFHASTWDDPEIGEIDWLLRLCDDPYPGAVAFAYDSAWPRLQELCADAITPEIKEWGDAYSAKITSIFQKLSEPPLVLAHADWRLDNLFFTNDGDVVAVDWQLIDRSVGPRDIAYLVTQSLELEGVEEYEAALAIYVADLARHGVVIDVGWALEMFRYGAALGFVYPVIAAGALTVNDDRHLELCTAMLLRSIAAMRALGVPELEF